MKTTKYEEIGRFIYGAHRQGGGMPDIIDWMADDLGVARPDPDRHDLVGDLYDAFFAKHSDPHELQENYDRFIDSLNRHAA